MAEAQWSVDWPIWIQAVAATTTTYLAWRLNQVTMRQAAIAEKQAATTEEQATIAGRQLRLEEQRDQLQRSRLMTLATRQAREVSNRLAAIARELCDGIDVGRDQEFYLSKGRACRLELEELRRIHEMLADRDGKPTSQSDYALEELTIAADELLQFDSRWEKIQADREGLSRRRHAFDAHMHLSYSIVHLCRSVEPPLSLPHGIPPQTGR